jgi:hypothetical protein
MNSKPNPTERFLISAVASFLNLFLRPAWYVMRSHMGIQHTALIPVILSGLLFGVCVPLLSWVSDINRHIILLYVVLVVVGYLRNTFQARRRRKRRDWSVTTWSSGESLLEPVLVFAARRVYRRWRSKPFVGWLVSVILRDDFIYYVGEPALLILVSAVLWSIGSSIFYYPIILAFGCIVFRNDAKLWLYLKAHEVPDGKRFERAIKFELDGPSPTGGYDIHVARIPEAPSRPAADNESVFERLSPELQDLLTKDRILHTGRKRAGVSKTNH